jgi:hypothetical protein
MSLNRIYQGSVSYVEIENPDKTARKEIPWLLYHHDLKRATEITKLIPELREKVEAEIAKRAKLSKEERKNEPKSQQLEQYEQLRDEQRKEWQSALWDHHQLFHDAVNYYAFTLAVMAEGMTEKDEDGKEKLTGMASFAEQLFGNGKPVTDSARVEGRWDDFVHKGGKRAGLKHSMARTLGLDVKTITREQCVDRIFGHAFAKFPKTADNTLNDVFRGVIGELFPAKSRGTPQQLANEDPGWLCGKDKGGEPPAEKTYRKLQGVSGFMDKLFRADKAQLVELSKLSVRDSSLSGVVERNDAGDNPEAEVEATQVPDDHETDDGASDEESADYYSGMEAVTQLAQCVQTAKSLLREDTFKFLFDRIGGGNFDTDSELKRLDGLVEAKRQEEEKRLKESPSTPSSFQFQEWRTQGPGKDNPRVQLFVLFHCAGGSDFTATLLKTRLVEKKLYLTWLHLTDKRRYVEFVEKFDLCGTAEGQEPEIKVDKARKAAAKLDYKPTLSTVAKTDFIPRLKKELGCIFPSFTSIKGFLAEEGNPAEPNGACKHGYSMLAKELTGVCHSVGLDPFLGFMHQPRYGRPALALDLMEEFRPLVADSVAISLINRGELGPEDFIRSANGTFLNDRGRRPFWEAWFRRLDAEVSHPEFSYKMAYRRMLEVQARQLWRFVRGEALTYHGFTTR